MPFQFTCPQCGRTFTDADHRKRKYCSTQCAKDAAKNPRLIQARFLSKLIQGPVNECWEWPGLRNQRGYGKFWDGFKMEYAHRMSYMIFIGPIPEGHDICHRCDNPPCANPHHLFVGDRRENMHDMKKKGRSAPGQGRWNAKLDADKVRAIR